MKKIIFPVIAFFVLLSVVGCKTKFNIAAPYKSITVIYGLLDESDTAHYIRIQKAFLDQNKSALTIAQNADSNFFPNINVRVEVIDYLGTGNIIDTIHLNKVDLNLEGYPKAPGVFFNSPNYAYKFKNALNPNYSYRIVVSNPVSGEVDSAEAPIIDDKDITTFTLPIIDNPTLNLGGMDFSSTLPFANFEITSTYNAPSNYNFYGQTTPDSIAQVIIRFNWIDSNVLTNGETEHSYDYNAGYATATSGNTFDYKIDDLSLYNAVFTAMGKAPLNIDRLLQKCDIFVYLSTPDYYHYMELASTQGVGLTANEIEPIYTNISGANALGIYTSRGVRTGNIAITAVTLDSLQTSSITSAANITGFTH